MLKHWKQRSTVVIKENPWWTYKLDQFEIPDGLSGEYHYVHTNGSSMVVPVTDDGRIILVNQYRFLCDKESIEFPCGGVKSGKSYEEMARLELEEETGFQATMIEHAGDFNPFNGVTNEMCRVFIARDLVKTEQKPDSTEEFEILFKTIQEFESMIKGKQIWDGMTLAAWSLVRDHITRR